MFTREVLHNIINDVNSIPDRLIASIYPLMVRAGHNEWRLESLKGRLRQFGRVVRQTTLRGTRFPVFVFEGFELFPNGRMYKFDIGISQNSRNGRFYIRPENVNSGEVSQLHPDIRGRIRNRVQEFL